MWRGPRHCPLDPGPRVPPQALPRVPRGGAGLLRRTAELPVMPRPGQPRGIPAGRRAGQVVQGGGDIITPLPDRVLRWSQLQRREHQDVDREPDDHPNAHVDQPGGEIAQRLVAAYQQHEQCREGNLRALPAQPPPAADHHPRRHDHGDARDRRTQQQGHRNRQHGAEHEPGHVLQALAQRPGHRGRHAQQRRQRSEMGPAGPPRTGPAPRPPSPPGRIWRLPGRGPASTGPARTTQAETALAAATTTPSRRPAAYARSPHCAASPAATRKPADHQGVPEGFVNPLPFLCQPALSIGCPQRGGRT